MSLAEELAQERRARLAAERLLELKQAELSAANEKLARHAWSLSEQIIEQREQVEVARTRAEALQGENRRVRHDLELAERRLWDSLETIRDGFAVFDRDDVMVAANSAYLSIFDGMECVAPGIRYPEILRILVEEGIVDTEGVAPADWVAGMLARWRSESLEPRVMKLWNGQFVRLVDRRSANGDTVSLGLNITESVLREEELKDARLKAEAASRAKSSFLARMSHELRTPMNGILGMVELLDETDLSEEQRLFLDTIRSSSEALLVLINDVLDFSKMEAGKFSLRIERFDLEACIHEVLAQFQSAVKDSGVELIIDYDLFLPTVFEGDAGRIRQILTNLVGNAVKFTSAGHVMVRVVGLPQEADRYRLHVTVEDTGIGVPAHMLEHIFGEFNQVEDETDRKYEGTGLGLAITRQLVELMGGEVWVESEEGAGACFGFHVSLPAPEAERGPAVALPGWARRVIVVSSPALSADVLARQMSAMGMEVVSMEAEEVTPARVSAQCDIILIDQNTPPGSGLAALRSIRETGVNCHVFLLYSGPPPRLREDDGPVTALKKPTSRKALLAALNRAEASGQAGAAGAAGGRAAARRRMRVLAAEDNRTNRLVFSKLLDKLNIDLELVENGHEVVKKWRSFRPDIVFMDISMPGMDGKEATRLIREAEVGRGHTPIVAMTAHAMAGDEDDILAAGLDHYLTKPLRREAILALIRDAVPEGVEPVFDTVEQQAEKPLNVGQG